MTTTTKEGNQSDKSVNQSAMTALESTEEAFEWSVELMIRIQRQRLFILDFLQGGSKATTQSMPF